MLARRNALHGLSLILACCACACSSGSDVTPEGMQLAQAGATSAVGCAQAGADVYAPGMSKVGIARRYQFELVSSLPAPPALSDNTFVMEVRDVEGTPVAGELSVKLDMPEHGHPSPAQPEISFDSAAKRFTLDPMRLFMVGLWRLTFDFQPATGAPGDSVVFEFCVD